MSVWDALRHRWHVLRHPSAYDRELADEQAFHLSLSAMQREHAAHGTLTGADAQFAARRRFGNLTQHLEETRVTAGLGFFDMAQQDVRFAWRSFARTPGFAIVAILTLAIGIGANTAIYSAIDALLLRPLPFVSPERLMKVSLTRPARGETPANTDAIWSWPKFKVFRDAQQSFSGVSLWADYQATLRGGVGDVERVQSEMTDAQYLNILGIRPLSGRNFLPEEADNVGGPNVALISEVLWSRRYNADPTLVGNTISIGGSPHVVVGILPRAFRGLSGRAEIWTPILVVNPIAAKEPWGHSFQQIARIKEGIPVEQAKAEVVQLGAVVDDAYPHPEFKGEKSGAIARELDATRVDPLVRRSLFILLGTVGLVLMIACANVANLFLVRAAGRGREIAVRLAVGAGRGRLVRQLLTESILLSAIGGVLGVLIAWGSVAFLSKVNPARAFNVQQLQGIGAIGFADIHLNISALLVAAGLSIATGLVFGLVPAWQATRASLADDLKPGGLRRRMAGWRGLNTRNLLVSTEIALALVLLAGSGLMVRSLAKLLSVSPGFASEQLLTMRLNVREGSARDSMPGFYEQIVERLSGLPGVAGVTVQDCPPLNGGCNGTSATRRDQPAPEAGTEPEVGVHWISSNWPAVMEVPLVKGRLFNGGDRAGNQKVVLVSETAAKRIWPGEDPIGKPVGIGQGGFHDTVYVAGVVGDVRYATFDSAPISDVYISHRQSPRSRMMIMVRTTGDPLTVASGVRSVIRELAPDLPLYDVRTMTDRMSDSTAYARFSTWLLVLFGVIALSLATLGIYGVIAFAVSQRTREIGIRMALGARSGDVVRMIVGHGLGVAALGAIAGLAGALAATRVLQSLLYDVAPTDPLTFVAIVVVLGAAVLAASWLPAQRAAGVMPTEALRQD